MSLRQPWFVFKLYVNNRNCISLESTCKSSDYMYRCICTLLLMRGCSRLYITAHNCSWFISVSFVWDRKIRAFKCWIFSSSRLWGLLPAVNHLSHLLFLLLAAHPGWLRGVASKLWCPSGMQGGGAHDIPLTCRNHSASWFKSYAVPLWIGGLYPSHLCKPSLVWG